MKPAEKIKRSFVKSSVKVGSDFDNRIMNDALITFEKSKTTKSAQSQPKIWRIIMKNRITKFSIAAVIVIAVIIGMHFIGSPFGATITFADVIKPILNARTIVFDFIASGEGKEPVIHDIVAGNKIRRTFSNMDTILIIDVDIAKMLTLDPKSKAAVYVDIQGPLQEETKSFIEFVRKTIINLKDLPVQKLGETNIDGLNAIGFQSKDPNEEITIWADSQTAQPIRIELRLGQTLYILKNIEIDVPVDKSLISMDVPVGYTLQKAEINMNEFTEQDFIESLRIWAKYLLNGNFPEKISVEDYLKTAPLVGEKIGQSGASKEDGAKLCMTFSRGLLFFQQLAPKGIDCQYAGRGAKLGDKEKAIFWYMPKGSQNYRVIYGDLNVREVSPENLPK